jgi:hypothetical protein
MENKARPSSISGPPAGLQQRSCAGKRAAGLQGLGSDGCRRRRASRAALFNCKLETSS